MEEGNSSDRGEDWARVEKLIALAKSAQRAEWTEERRQRIRDELLAKLARHQARGRAARAIAAFASALLRSVRAALPWVGRSSTGLARRRTGPRLVAG